MTASILVIGAGVSGLAAVWAAHRSGQTVRLVSESTGASALGSGALDDVPWDADPRGAGRIARSPEMLAFLVDLGLHRLADGNSPPPLLATLVGRLRPACGHDASLLDLARVDGGRVLVPRAAVTRWDADALVAVANADPRRQRITFVASDVALLLREDERRFPDVDLAALHDDSDRLAWLAEQLGDALRRSGANAVLMGPWLGVREPRAPELERLLGVPVGEALAGYDSPAGVRFEAARDRLLGKLGVALERGRVERITACDAGFCAKMGGGSSIEARRVVLATGGVIAGGVVYEPPEHAAARSYLSGGGLGFRASVDVEGAEIGAGESAFGRVSSMNGPDLDLIAWPHRGDAGLLEAVGLIPRSLPRGVSIAGDAMAGGARTMLAAIETGLAAARA